MNRLRDSGLELSPALRAGEWWDHKISGLLTTGYLTSKAAGRPHSETFGRLAVAVAVLAPGAAYVSVVNDLTDLEVDARAGKHNRLDGVPRTTGLAMAAACGAIGWTTLLVTTEFDAFIVASYAGAWVAFTAYSVPPVRLKARGALGAVADGAGSSLFPHLTVAALVLGDTARVPRAVWLSLVASWSMSAGLRGAIWHQVSDVDADLQAGIATFAAVDAQRAIDAGRRAFAVESIALAGMLRVARSWWAMAAFGPYVALEAARRRSGAEVVLVGPVPEGRPYRIFLHEYVVAVLPLTVLAQGALTDRRTLALLGLHVAAFPGVVGDLRRTVAAEAQGLVAKIAGRVGLDDDLRRIARRVRARHGGSDGR